MRMPFVPKSFTPPNKASLDDKYYLIPIYTSDVVEDWSIITSNAEIISKIRGAGSRKEWPFTCTLEENYKDLAWLELCAKYKQLFCYIIRNKKDDLYVGAIYIYPIELFFSEKSDKFDVDFSFWIVKSEFDKNKYEYIFKKLLTWLIKDWPFKKERIFLRNKIIPKDLQ